jgi:hypothetical protein
MARLGCGGVGPARRRNRRNRTGAQRESRVRKRYSNLERLDRDSDGLAADYDRERTEVEELSFSRREHSRASTRDDAYFYSIDQGLLERVRGLRAMHPDLADRGPQLVERSARSSHSAPARPAQRAPCGPTRTLVQVAAATRLDRLETLLIRDLGRTFPQRHRQLREAVANAPRSS